MHLFEFQPDDGTCYTILFGRLPAASPFIEHYTVFGFRDDYTLPLLTYPFDNERITFDTFAGRLDQPGVNPIRGLIQGAPKVCSERLFDKNLLFWGCDSYLVWGVT